MNPDLLKAFRRQDFKAALRAAEALQEPLRSQAVCTIHIKNQDFGALDGYLSGCQEQRQHLLFFQAYSDYMNKKDASWFLRTENTHRLSHVLKQQILYRQQRYSQAAALQTDDQLATSNFEQTVNNYALAIRTGRNYYPAKTFGSFEFCYNEALHSFQCCNFAAAEASLQRARRLLDEDPDASAKDREHLQVLDIILQKYAHGTDTYYELGGFKFQDSRSMLELFKLATLIAFRFSPDFICEIRQRCADLMNDLNAVKLRCDPSLRTQLLQFMQVVANFQVFNARFRRFDNCGQFMQRCNELSCATNLPGQGLAKKARKLSGGELQTELAEVCRKVGFQGMRLRYSQQQRAYFADLYQAFGNVQACAQLGRCVANGLLVKMDYGTARQQVAPARGENLALQAEPSAGEKEAKQMPLKWQKKKKRGANAGKHQGADVRDRQEVSKVKVQTNYRKGGRRH